MNALASASANAVRWEVNDEAEPSQLAGYILLLRFVPRQLEAWPRANPKDIVAAAS